MLLLIWPLVLGCARVVLRSRFQIFHLFRFSCSVLQLLQIIRIPMTKLLDDDDDDDTKLYVLYIYDMMCRFLFICLSIVQLAIQCYIQQQQ